jgi:mannose-6-phosphate isomerase-like protein (cupin superfamily)
VITVQRTVADTDEMAKLPPVLLDDARDWQGVVVIKPWGSEVEIKKEGAVSVTLLSLNPGKTALLVVADGYCELESLSVIYKLRPGQMVAIEPGAFHRVRTEGGAKILEVESPPGKSNIVRLADRYGRQQGYECA